MSVAEKLTAIAENVERVYGAGYEKGLSEGNTGGVELPALDVPAEPSDIRLGKEVINAAGEKVTGTMPEHLESNTVLTIGEPTFKVKEGYHSGCHVGVNARAVTKAKALKDETVIVRDESGAFMATVEIEPAIDIYNEGHKTGYADGYDDGEDAGYNNGLAVGTEEGYSNGYEKGIKYGEDAARMECESKHFSQAVMGSGTTELVFPTPFKPDFISITTFDPTGMHTTNAVAYFVMDVETIGFACGTYGLYLGGGGGFDSAAMTSKSTTTRFSWVNGETKVYNLNNGVFDSNLTYVVSASTYTDKPLRQRMEEFIRDMKSGASASFHRIKINEAFPIYQEWEELVATRPDCTFNVYNV